MRLIAQIIFQLGIEKSRTGILSSLGLPSWKLIATSGATESNNLALFGFLATHKKGHFITVKTEHKSILEPAEYLSENGFNATFLNVDSNGQIDIDEFRSAIRDDTVLLSFSFVNNETGIIQKNWRGNRNQVELLPLNFSMPDCLNRIRVDGNSVFMRDFYDFAPVFLNDARLVVHEAE